MPSLPRLIYEFDDFQLEPEERKLIRRGEVVPLHGKAFEMLLVLIRNRGRLLTKEELFQLVWPDQIVEESNLTVNMSAIRRALGERATQPHYITTVSGRGYRFNGDVRQLVDETLTIERETYARMVVHEETESTTFRVPSTDQVARAVRSVTSHPVLVGAACALVLVIGIASFWVSGVRRREATPPWSTIVFRPFATHGGVPFRVAISPDGKSLVYDQRLNGRDSLWLGQIESNSSVQILDQADITYNGLTFSPDGQTVYFTEYNSARLFRLPVVGGVPSPLSRNVDSAVSFSPDGRQFAFLRRESGESTIIVADAPDGRNERALITRKQPSSFSSAGLSWSPNGKLIAVAVKNEGGRVGLLAIGVNDGLTTKISDREWGEIGNVKWQSDGSGLLFTERAGALARKSAIWCIPYPQGEPRKITNDLNQYLIQILSLSQTGTLAVMDGITESEIWMSPDGVIAPHRVLQGISPKYEGVDGLAWTPEGHLLYTAYVGDAQAIWETDGNGGNPRQLTNNASDFVDRQMSVTADDRYIVFQSNRSGGLQIWRANRDGTDLRQLTTSGNNTQPSLSPNSKWIVYVSDSPGHSTLWRMSIDGSEMIQVTHENSYNPQVSADGSRIAYIASSPSAPPHLTIIPFGGGEPVKSFVLPERPGPNLAKRMCWTPDGKALVYTDTMQGLWLQRLDQQQPELMKGFEDVQVAQLAWSIQGRGLAYTRFANMQEIILLQSSQ